MKEALICFFFLINFVMIKIYQKLSRTDKNTGFTLLELLVVVLIIGILAAVAVPQYEVAVGKSKLAKMEQLCRTMKNAAEVYYWANGDYGWTHGYTAGEHLDVSFPDSCTQVPNDGSVHCGDISFILNQTNGTQNCTARYQGGRIWLTYSHYFDHSPTRAGQRTCAAVAGDSYPISKRVCKSAGGIEESPNLFVLP